MHQTIFLNILFPLNVCFRCAHRAGCLHGPIETYVKYELHGPLHQARCQLVKAGQPKALMLDAYALRLLCMFMPLTSPYFINKVDGRWLWRWLRRKFSFSLKDKDICFHMRHVCFYYYFCVGVCVCVVNKHGRKQIRYCQKCHFGAL